MVLKIAFRQNSLIKLQNPVEIAISVRGLQANKPQIDGEDVKWNSFGFHIRIDILDSRHQMRAGSQMVSQLYFSN